MIDLTVSKAFSPLEKDRYMHPEIQSVIELVRENRIWEVVEPHLIRMNKMEERRPNALRQEASRPTAAIFGAPDYSHVL